MIKRLRPKSLNEEIKDAMIDYIKSMNSRNESKLPREEVLSKELGVSRATLRDTLLALAKEGLIYRKHGKGTFINPEVLKMKVTLIPSLEFDKVILNSGYSSSVRLVSFETNPANEKLAKRLQIAKGDDVVFVKKIAYADENPAIYWINRFPKKLVEGEILQSEIIMSIFDYLKMRAGKKIIRDIVEISTVLNGDVQEFADYIDSSKIKPLLLCKCLNLDEDNNPVLFGTVYYDTTFVKFHLSRQMDNIYSEDKE